MRVLVCQTESLCPSGTLGESLAAEGLELLVWRADLDACAPALFGYDAVLALGGAANPDDDDRHEWLESVRGVLGAALRRGMPTLGLCLGAQLLAQVGGAVASRLGQPEIGWVELCPTPGGRRDPLYQTLPGCHEAFEWHSYGFPLPPGAELLAGTRKAVQAFRLGTCAWGLQFHLEAGERIVNSWIDHYRDELERTGPDPAELVRATALRATAYERDSRRFARAFAALIYTSGTRPGPWTTAA